VKSIGKINCDYVIGIRKDSLGTIDRGEVVKFFDS